MSPAPSACLKLGGIPLHFRPADPGDTVAARKSLIRPLERSATPLLALPATVPLPDTFPIPPAFHPQFTLFTFVSPSIHDFHAKNFRGALNLHSASWGKRRKIPGIHELRSEQIFTAGIVEDDDGGGSGGGFGVFDDGAGREV